MEKHLVICIGRQFGSGGREIGLGLAKKLGIRFYDKEILKRRTKSPPTAFCTPCPWVRTDRP